MRTTVAIDDDVLAFARAEAARRQSSVGEALSDLAREAMRNRSGSRSRLGFPTLPKRGVVVTLDLVNALRDQE